MKKEDLKNGAILETRSGEHCFVIDHDLFFIESGLQSDLYRFNDNLKETEGFVDDDIMKVCLEPMKNNQWDWVRKETPILTDDERGFLKMVNPKWKWIVVYSDGISFYSDEPYRMKIRGGSSDGFWTSDKESTCVGFNIFSIIFDFKKFKDEPYSIEELLKGSEEDEEDRTSKVRP